MEPMISIIVPVYGVEKYLDKCIRSIVNQTYSNLEIILVDDGSPDRCPEICDEWSRKDTRINVIHRENGGVSAARNTGIAVATGSFIAFVDSDDAVVSTMCEKVMQAFMENSADIVVFNLDRVTENGKSIGGTESLTIGMLSREDALRNLVRGKINDYMCNKVYRRSLFDGIRFSEHRICYEDMDITYRLFLKAERIYCLTDQLYLYYQRSNSISANITAPKIQDLYQIRMERYRTLIKDYPQIAELALPRLTAAALCFYDYSLWEKMDPPTLTEVKRFLSDNREKVLSVNKTLWFRIYYFFPQTYRCLRRIKHLVGNVIKFIKRKMDA